MARKFSGEKLIIASHNQGKVREIGDLLRPFGVQTVSVGDLGYPVPDEDGSSFIENARIKSLAAAKVSGLPALSDDSGLSVDALNGEPGIDTALWAGPDRNFDVAMQRVIEAVGGSDDKDNWAAHFVCALSLAWPDGHTEDFEGKVYGDLTWPMRGDKGFGLDPIFVPRGHSITFAEMEPADKHAMSHRADAFRQLVGACFQT